MVIPIANCYICDWNFFKYTIMAKAVTDANFAETLNTDQPVVAENWEAMKRVLFLIALCLSLFTEKANAQFGFGVTGGTSFGSAKYYETDVRDPLGYFAGLAFNVDLPYGFSVQPGAQFCNKGAMVNDLADFQVSYIEVPVSVQWGPDLLVFRPFVDAGAFVGYHLFNRKRTSYVEGLELITSYPVDLQKVEYGVSLGGGIDIWKLRLTAKYFWNMGPLFKENKKGVLKVPGDNFKGLTLSLSVFFL